MKLPSSVAAAPGALPSCPSEPLRAVPRHSSSRAPDARSKNRTRGGKSLFAPAIRARFSKFETTPTGRLRAAGSRGARSSRRDRAAPQRPAHPRPKMAAAPHTASRPRGPSRAAGGARPRAEPPPRAGAAGSRSPPPRSAARRPVPSPPPCRDHPRAVRRAAGRSAVRRGSGGSEGRRTAGGGLRAPWCTAARARLRVGAAAGGSGGRKRRSAWRGRARGAGPERAGSRHAPGQHGLPDPAGGAAGAHHLPQPRGAGLRREPAPAAAAA